MTYLDYIVFLEKCDQAKSLSGNAYKLYLKLLAIANAIGWPTEFAKSDSYVAAVCGFSENTMKDCRAKLVEVGLLTTVPGKMGRGATTSYRLLGHAKTKNKVSNSDTLCSYKPSEIDTLPNDIVSISDTINAQKGPNKVSKFDTPYIDKNREEESSAASAAATSDFSDSITKTATPSATSKPAPKKPKPKGATHEEIATLPLPFTGAEFAEAWRTFYTTNTKQQTKAITAFMLMLKKLGKMPEGFAVEQLERAVMSDWQGVEHGGTPRDLAQWLAEQAQKPTPASIIAMPAAEVPEVNPDFLAQQNAAAAAKRAARMAELTAP